MRPKNLVNIISQIKLKGISPNFGHTFISIHRCAEGQKVKDQGHNTGAGITVDGTCGVSSSLIFYTAMQEMCHKIAFQSDIIANVCI